MAAEHMIDVEVLTPEGEVFAGEARQVSTRTEVGEIGILANHTPLLAALRPTELRLKLSDSETRRYAQAHGWLQVFGNRARLLVEEAIAPEDLDAGALKEQLSDAERRLGEAEEGTAEHARAEKDRDRAEAFLARVEPGSEPGRRRPLHRWPADGRNDLTRPWPEAAATARPPERRRDPIAGTSMSDELVALAKRLIGYETSEPEAITEAAGFVKGWLEARGIEAEHDLVRGLPVIRAEVGPASGADGRARGPHRRRPRPARAVRAAARRRPALRPRRLRHEGGAGGDDGRDRGDAGLRTRVRVRLGVVGDEESEEGSERGCDHLVDSRLRRRLRDHRRADRSAHRDRGQGRAGAAARGRPAGRPTAPPRGSATTPFWARSTFSAVSSRYRLPGTARSCSTAPRSTWEGSWAATLSTRCPTDA